MYAGKCSPFCSTGKQKILQPPGWPPICRWEVAQEIYLFAVHLLLIIRHVEEFLLESAAEGDDRLSTMSLHPGVHLGQVFALFADEVLLRQIHQVGDGLGCDELDLIQEVDVLDAPLTKPAAIMPTMSGSNCQIFSTTLSFR